MHGPFPKASRFVVTIEVVCSTSASYGKWPLLKYAANLYANNRV